MASRRKIKKDINYLCLEVIADCYNYNYLHIGKEEKVDSIVRTIVADRNDLIARVNNPDGKENSKITKAYYKSISIALMTSVDKAFTNLSELIKEK